MSRLRVVYLWDADYPWDVRTEKVCLALTQAGHEVHIVARNGKWQPETETLPEGTVHRMRPWRWLGQRLDKTLGFPAFFSPRWYILLARTMHGVKSDVVIVRDLPLCPTAIRAARKAGIPVILDMAENYPATMRDLRTSSRRHPLDIVIRNPHFVQHVEQYCVSRVDHIVTVVEESSDRLFRMGVPRNRVTVVSNTPSRERALELPAAKRQSADGLEIIYLGLLEISRGIGDAIHAVAQLREMGHRVRLRLIGSGRDEQFFRQQVRTLGLDEDVTFFGYLPYADALKIVGQADVGLIPHHATESWNTTIPNKLFDYMAAGIPVLSSNAAPCVRIVSDTGAGVVFQSNDPASLASAAIQLLEPAVRATKGAAGRQAILNRYNWEFDTNSLLKVVDSL